MKPQASVTLTLDEYRKLSDNLHPGGAALIACVAFGIGLVLGMSTFNEERETTPPRQPAVVQPGETSRFITPSSVTLDPRA